MDELKLFVTSAIEALLLLAVVVGAVMGVRRMIRGPHETAPRPLRAFPVVQAGDEGVADGDLGC